MADTADLYLRISLDRTGEEAGVDRQEVACLALCERQGWGVRHVFKDNSVSAVKAKRRPSFEKMIEARPERIVMWSVDRLVRKGADLERLIELDIPVHSVVAGPMDLATASGRLNARLLTSVATFEGEIKAERQRAAASQRAAQGKPWWPRRPLGFNMDGTAHSKEAAVLAQCYDLLLAGSSLRDLARHLNEASVETNTGRPWTASSLRPVLLNPRNIAVRAHNGLEVGPAAWASLVPEDAFRSAVRLLNNPARRTGGGGARIHLLTGIAECAECGAPLRKQGRPARASKPAYAVYTCSAKSCASVRVLDLDAIVRKSAVLLLQRPEMAAVWARGAAGDVAEVRAEAVRLRGKLAGLLEDYGEDLLTRSEYHRLAATAKGKLLDAEQRLAESAGAGPASILIGAVSIEAAWAEMTLDQERAAVQWLFKRVAVRSKGRGVRHLLPSHIVLEVNGLPEAERRLKAVV